MYNATLNSSLNYVNKPSLENWNPWIWRITAAVSGILCGLATIYPIFAWLIWLAPAAFLFSILAAHNKPLTEYLWRSGLFAVCYYALALSGLLTVADHLPLPRWQAGLLVLLITALCVVLLSLLWLLAAVIYGLCQPAVPVSFAFWPLVCYLIEWLQGHIFGGFPAISLGVSQGVYPLLCQSAGCWGATGLSSLIILINILLAATIFCRRWRYLLLALAIFIINIVAGLVDWHFDTPPERTLQVAAANSDIMLEQRWDSSYDSEIFAIYAGQAANSRAEGAQLLLLPETALPYVLQSTSGYGSRFLQLANQNQLTLVVGGFAEHNRQRYNSLFSATPASAGGKLTEIYSKRALVPFGEYIPLKGLCRRLLPDGFWASFTLNILQSGGKQGAATIILADKSRVSTAQLICYDLCFADYPRQAVNEGAQLLLAASNDVWYRDTCVIYQHLNHAILRAIEYNRPLLNSTNGGYSAVIDNQGRILALTNPNTAQAKTAMAEVGLTSNLTLFSRYGQYHIFIIALIWLAVSVIGWLCRPADNYKFFSIR